MDAFTQLMDFVFAHASQWLDAALAVVAAASAVTALTPSPKDDSWLARLRAVLETLALNIGHAKPAEPESRR